MDKAYKIFLIIMIAGIVLYFLPQITGVLGSFSGSPISQQSRPGFIDQSINYLRDMVCGKK